MPRSLRIGIVVISLLIIGAVSLLLYVRNRGFSAREKPSRLEEIMARNARRIATPAAAKELKNHRPQTEAGMSEAREHFVEHCSICHGVDGRGATTIGRNLYPKVPDMTNWQTQRLSDGELFYIISNGVRFTGMPAWGGEDSPESIWALVSFIRRLPQLTPEELKQMQEQAGGAHGESAGESATPQTEGTKRGEKDESGKDQKPAKPQTHSHGPGANPHAH
jgi:mono/diheme cytochrome c family protein